MAKVQDSFGHMPKNGRPKIVHPKVRTAGHHHDHGGHGSHPAHTSKTGRHATHGGHRAARHP